MRKATVIVTLGTLALLPAFARNAGAATEMLCIGYVQQALAYAQEWRQLGCGPTDDPRWSTDEAVHRGWCLESKEESVNGEAQRRLIDMTACKCGKYADSAIVQNSRNLQNSCGFTGVEWSGTREDHFNWCNDGNLSRAQGETDKREALLTQCKPQ
jgi:hypothetical protein